MVLGLNLKLKNYIHQYNRNQQYSKLDRVLSRRRPVRMDTQSMTNYLKSVELFESERKLHFCRLSESIPKELLEKIWLQQQESWPDEKLRSRDFRSRSLAFENDMEAFIKRLEDRESCDVNAWKGVLELYKVFEANYDPAGILMCMYYIAFFDVIQQEKFYDSLNSEELSTVDPPVWVEFGRILNLPEYQGYVRARRRLERAFALLLDDEVQHDRILDAIKAEEALKTLYVYHPFGDEETYLRRYPHLHHAHPLLLWCILALLYIDTSDVYSSPRKFYERLEKIPKEQFLNTFQVVALHIWIPYCFPDVC